MSDPQQVEVPLPELVTAGVLMAANERVFWPLGLALTWDQDMETGDCRNLRITEWRWADGHHESIELDPSDPVGPERRRAFQAYVTERAASMPPAESTLARVLLGRSAR